MEQFKTLINMKKGKYILFIVLPDLVQVVKHSNKKIAKEDKRWYYNCSTYLVEYSKLTDNIKKMITNDVSIIDNIVNENELKEITNFLNADIS